MTLLRTLGIIHHSFGTGGIERLLYGLLSGMLQHPQGRDWHINVFVEDWTSPQGRATWPPALRGPNLEVHHRWHPAIERVFEQLRRSPRRIAGIPGSSWLRYHVPRASMRHCMPALVRAYGLHLVYSVNPDNSPAPRVGVPLVATPHDVNYLHFGANARRRRYWDRLRRTWLKTARAVVVSSDFIRSEYQRFYPEYIDKVRVVRAGVPQPQRQMNRAQQGAWLQAQHVPDSFLLCPAWIARNKNQHVLLRALSMLRKEGSQISIVFTGPNSHLLTAGAWHDTVDPHGYVGQVRRVARECGLSEGGDFIALGYVNEEELDCLYRHALAMVMPTLYEAGSFPVREAMAAGCPVICSNIPSLAEEVALVGGAAWCFDPHDAKELASVIRTVMTDDGERERRVARARGLAPGVFDWRRMAAGYLSVFDECLASPR